MRSIIHKDIKYRKKNIRAHIKAGTLCMLTFAAIKISVSAVGINEECSIVFAEESGPVESVKDYAIIEYCPKGKEDNYIPLYTAVEDHVVTQGESLWSIAESVYADGGRWQDISAENSLPDPDLIIPGQILSMPDEERYICIPVVQRGKGYYMQDEGAFRFQTPERWSFATCSLDAHLSTFIGEDSSVRILWGVEDNEMGEDAWAETWDEVCTGISHSAQEVYGEDLESISFERYTLKNGSEVYNIRCIFRSEKEELWTVSAAYRFGEKNLMEFIGIGAEDHRLDIGNLTLYTAVTYEEYEEERHMGFGDEPVVYKGMEVWDYPTLHNPFVIAYESVNKRTWYRKRELNTASEDYIIEWKEPVLPAVIKAALEIEGDIMYSDLLKIESLEVIESVGYDYCSINDTRYETNWKDIPDGDALVEDISNCPNLYSLRIQIGDITDYSPLGKLVTLNELIIQAGRTVTDIGFLDDLTYLRTCILEKAPQQILVDSLDDKLWERTCEEEGLTTFRKEYDGEPGLAFDRVENQ